VLASRGPGVRVNVLGVSLSQGRRSQVTAAIGAVNAQLRADEQRLRRKTQGDTLERLLKLIEEGAPKIAKLAKKSQEIEAKNKSELFPSEP
jgi:hypothetical protein